MNTRNLLFDIIKGIGIILMIIGHLTQYATNIIFSFHMPLFFILSGYFYKQTDIKSGLINDAKRLIIPYIITSYCNNILPHIVNCHVNRLGY